MAFFKSRQKSDIEQISVRIEEAEQALSAAEQALTAKAATAALEKDVLAATQAERAAVDEARARLSILQDGLAFAERAERLRQREAHVKGWDTQKRAIRQKIAIVEKAGLEFETALDVAMSAYRRAILASKDVDRLLPIGGEWEHFRGALRRIPEEAVAEFNARCSVHELSGEIGLPNAHRAIGHHPSTHVPLSARLKGLLMDHYQYLCEDPEPPEHMAPDAAEPVQQHVEPPASEVPPAPNAASGEPAATPAGLPNDPQFVARQVAAARGIEIDDLMAAGLTEEQAIEALDQAKKKSDDTPSVADLVGAGDL